MNRKQFELMAIGYYLSDSEELTLAEQLEVIREADNDELVMYLDGVLVWEQVDNMTVGEMWEQIEMLANDFEKCYLKGKEDA